MCFLYSSSSSHPDIDNHERKILLFRLFSIFSSVIFRVILSIYVMTLIIVEVVRRNKDRRLFYFRQHRKMSLEKKLYIVLPFTHSALVCSFRIVIEIGVAAGVVIR